MTEASFHQFEGRLEQLERLVHKPEVSVSELLSAAMDTVNSLADGRDLQLWLVRPDTLEQVTENGCSMEVASHQRADILQAVERGSVFRLIATAATGREGAHDDTQNSRRLCVASPLAEHLNCVLSVQVDEVRVPELSFVQATRAVADVLASWLSHHLLSQLEVRLQAQATLLDFGQRLLQCTSLTEAADVVAQDAPGVLGECRASVLQRVESGFQLLAVTGVRKPDATSETVRALQILAAQESVSPDAGASESTALWKSVRTTETASAPARSNAIATLQRSGTSAYRVLPIAAANPSSAATPDHQLVVVVELFGNSQPPDEGLVQQWLHIVASVLERCLQPPRKGMAGWFTTRRRRLAILVACAIGLAIFPTDFEVEVPGRIMAANQRNIFAPDNGTIDEVAFENEHAVQQGQVLIRMSNPDLQLELRRIQGEIDTTLAKLATARASRLTTADPRFSSDEQQLEVQHESLKQQVQLVQQQTAALQITAPVSGTAFRRDAERNLLARPVQRGQSLLEIVPDSAAWELHLEIPARLLSYVVQHQRDLQQQQQPGASVRYLIRSAPQQDWSTELDTVEHAVQSENGQLVCHATAAAQNLPDMDLRPGTSVTARIHCGRRSLGFVLFREILDVWRQIQFAWF